MPSSWARLSQSGRGLGEYVPFVGVMPDGHPGSPEEFDLAAGVIVVATGFRPYRPRRGEYGYREFPEVVTLPEFIRLMAEAEAGDTLVLDGRPIRRAAMIHCVGSRQIPGIHAENEGGYLNEYCSRTCCSATLYAANLHSGALPQNPGLRFLPGHPHLWPGAGGALHPGGPKRQAVLPLRGRGGAAGLEESRCHRARRCWSR